MPARRSFLDVRVPFFRPLLPRLLVTGVTLGWAAFELASGNVFWAMLFGVAGFWCLWEFFIVYDPENYTEKTEKDET